MQRERWRALWNLVEHSLISTSAFVAVTAMAAFVAKFVAIASTQIESKFVIYVLIFLEYAIVAVDAFCLLMFLVELVIEKLRSSMR